MTTTPSEASAASPAARARLAAGLRGETPGRLRDPSSLVAIALAVAVALGIWLSAHRDVPYRLWAPDEFQYAEIARRLTNGEGWTTGVIYPLEVSFGTGEDKPLLGGTPVWILSIAAAFELAGPRDAVVLGASLLFHLLAVATATALAIRAGGLALGAVAGAAIAVSPQNSLYALTGGAESAFTFILALVFLLAATRRDALWLGLACGLAYATRPIGAAIVPVGMLWILRRPLPWAAMVRFGVGVGVVVTPWFARMWLVTGDPFFSFQNILLHQPADVLGERLNLMRMLEPDLQASIAVQPLDKVTSALPRLLLASPLASANLAALLGVLLGALRRDRLCLGFMGVALLTSLLASLTFPNGRYFVPLVPVALALGAAAWGRYGGPFRLPALALLLAAPLLPSVPAEYPDVKFVRQAVEHAKTAHPDHTQATERLAECLVGRPLVIAEDAPRVAWTANAIAIYLPWRASDFWTLVDREPVRFAQFRGEHSDIRGGPRFARRFRPRPDCGDGIFERR